MFGFLNKKLIFSIFILTVLFVPSFFVEAELILPEEVNTAVNGGTFDRSMKTMSEGINAIKGVTNRDNLPDNGDKTLRRYDLLTEEATKKMSSDSSITPAQLTAYNEEVRKYNQARVDYLHLRKEMILEPLS